MTAYVAKRRERGQWIHHWIDRIVLALAYFSAGACIAIAMGGVVQ